MFFTLFIFLPAAFVAFFADFILAVLISVSADGALFLPLALLWAVLGTGVITLLLGVLMTALMDIELADDIIKRLPSRILYSYLSAAALIYGGVLEDKLFYPGFAAGGQFVPFLVLAFLACTGIYVLHWWLTRRVCRAIVARRTRKRNAWYARLVDSPSGGSDVHVSTYEEERQKELEKFAEIVENQ